MTPQMLSRHRICNKNKTENLKQNRKYKTKTERKHKIEYKTEAKTNYKTELETKPIKSYFNIKAKKIKHLKTLGVVVSEFHQIEFYRFYRIWTSLTSNNNNFKFNLTLTLTTATSSLSSSSSTYENSVEPSELDDFSFDLNVLFLWTAFLDILKQNKKKFFDL